MQPRPRVVHQCSVSAVIFALLHCGRGLRASLVLSHTHWRIGIASTPPLSTLGKAALAGCAVALEILAWAPSQAMTRTSLGGHAERFVAYLGTAMVFGLASRKWLMPCIAFS